jgi:sulfur carrier protein ThiS
MPIANLAAIGATRKMLGFSKQTVEFEGSTVSDLLQQLQTLEGCSLYDRLVCDGKLRPEFAIVVDGLSLKADQLDKQLNGGEQVVTLAIVRSLAGG